MTIVRSGLWGISAVDVARSRLEPTMSFSGPAPLSLFAAVLSSRLELACSVITERAIRI